jgi:hypothetical protein
MIREMIQSFDQDQGFLFDELEDAELQRGVVCLATRTSFADGQTFSILQTCKLKKSLGVVKKLIVENSHLQTGFQGPVVLRHMIAVNTQIKPVPKTVYDWYVEEYAHIKAHIKSSTIYYSHGSVGWQSNEGYRQGYQGFQGFQGSVHEDYCEGFQGSVRVPFDGYQGPSHEDIMPDNEVNVPPRRLVPLFILFQDDFAAFMKPLSLNMLLEETQQLNFEDFYRILDFELSGEILQVYRRTNSFSWSVVDTQVFLSHEPRTPGMPLGVVGNRVLDI